MKSPCHLRIVHYSDKRVADPRGATALSYQDFHRARNAVLATCRLFGTVGAMAEYPLDASLTEIASDAAWAVTPHSKPDFFVVDDQLNNDRYIYIEISPQVHVSSEWLCAMATCLLALDGWGIAITNVTNGYVIVLAQVLLLHGPVFDGCKDLEEVAYALRMHLN